MRVIAMYRAEDGELADNWIFNDILQYLNVQALDLLAGMEGLSRVLICGWSEFCLPAP
jgi:hypothetical protein